jgi:hypothetical protein
MTQPRGTRSFLHLCRKELLPLERGFILKKNGRGGTTEFTCVLGQVTGHSYSFTCRAHEKSASLEGRGVSGGSFYCAFRAVISTLLLTILSAFISDPNQQLYSIPAVE